jgi:hypothetical protein
MRTLGTGAMLAGMVAAAWILTGFLAALVWSLVSLGWGWWPL